MQFRVSLLAALALGGVSSGAEAAIKVNATIDGQATSCADAVNVKFSPAAARTDMRFTYECVAEGISRGEIARALRGSGGFGYDPLFWLPSLGKTAAELDAEHKNRISHRAIALQKLLALLNDGT